MRDDLLKEVERLVRKGGIDQIVIESTGISEPVPVAQTFSYIDEELGIDLTAICRLDTMVTVVDANRFINDIQSEDLLMDRDESIGDADDRTIADLLIDQVEFCDVMIINKIDLVSKEALAKLEKTLRALQPEARMIKTVNAEVDLSEVLNTQLFDFEKASESAGWIKNSHMADMNIIRLRLKNMAFHHLCIVENFLSTLIVLKSGSIIYLAIL